MKTPVKRLDYCQYLLVSQINYTLTNFADHCEQFSHDAINRYLRKERITPRLVWENVRGQVVPSAQSYVVFDDTVLDKNASFAIDLVRRQYKGGKRDVYKRKDGVTMRHPGIISAFFVAAAFLLAAGSAEAQQSRQWDNCYINVIGDAICDGPPEFDSQQSPYAKEPRVRNNGNAFPPAVGKQLRDANLADMQEAASTLEDMIAEHQNSQTWGSIGDPQPLVCNNEEVVEGVKWYPGHYMRIWTDGKNDAVAREFLENPYTMGLTLHMKWSDVEKSEGQYDFSRIEKYIKMADAYGKKVVLKIMESCFHGCTDAFSPSYLKIKYNGVTASKKGSTVNLWDPKIVDRYMALFQAIGSKYDGHRALSGVVIKGNSESALPVERSLKVQVEDAYVAQLHRMAREAKEYFPHTITYTGINFVKETPESATKVFNSLAQEIIEAGGGGFTHTDTIPTADIPNYPVERKYSDQMAIFPQIQTSQMGKYNVSEEDIYDFSVNNLGAHAINWNAWFSTLNGEQRPNYIRDYVLPVLSKHKGAINTACPTSYSKCITQCD